MASYASPLLFSEDDDALELLPGAMVRSETPELGEVASKVELQDAKNQKEDLQRDMSYCNVG